MVVRWVMGSCKTRYYPDPMNAEAIRPSRIVLVGLAGGTGSGKTTIVQALRQRLGGCVLETDAYYLDRTHIGLEDRRAVNYDEPAAIDSVLLVEHLAQLRRNERIERPLYSFESHTRIGTVPMTPAGIIFVEGLFTLWWPDLRALFDLKVFVDAPADVRLMRRLRRDICDRGRTIDDVLDQYTRTVRSMHELYVEPTRAVADLIVANDRNVVVSVDSIARAIEELLDPKSGCPK